jgi:hypothetical protein
LKLNDKLMRKFRKKIFSIIKSWYDKQALINLKKQTTLWHTLSEYIKLSDSTGCSYSDYWTLYSYVKNHKPKEILECGTGVSTIILAHAAMENESEHKISGRITSMENVKTWYTKAREAMPNHLKRYIDLILSEKTEYYFSIFRGVGYKDVPARPYDFVFIDAPDPTAPSDGTTAFDFDYLNVVMQSVKPVFGIIDKRLGTSYVFQKVFGVKKVVYDPKRDLCFVGPFSKEDIKAKVGSSSFLHSLRIIGKTKLNLQMRR